jgi:pimeloyl-ACP methyl ester carboxylesterase
MRWIKRLLIGVVLLLLVGVGYQQWAERHDAELYPPPGRMVSVGDHKLHIWCIGAGTPTVLMLSGGGTPVLMLHAAQQRIAKFTRVCSYDRTGLGWSDPATKPMALGDVVTDLEVLLAKSGIEGPLVLVPESMGGLVALAYARRNLDRVAGAVFVDASETKLWFKALAPTVPEFKAKEWQWQFGWRTGIVRLALPFAKPKFVDDFPPDIQRQFYTIWSRPNAGYFRDFIDIAEQTPVADQLATVAGSWGDRPIIALRHGKVDEWASPATEPGWPAAQARLAALSSAGRVKIATQNSHPIAEENPQLVADSVREIVQELRTAQEPGRATQARPLPIKSQ